MQPVNTIKDGYTFVLAESAESRESEASAVLFSVPNPPSHYDASVTDEQIDEALKEYTADAERLIYSAERKLPHSEQKK